MDDDFQDMETTESHHNTTEVATETALQARLQAEYDSGYWKGFAKGEATVEDKYNSADAVADRQVRLDERHRDGFNEGRAFGNKELIADSPILRLRVLASSETLSLEELQTLFKRKDLRTRKPNIIRALKIRPSEVLRDACALTHGEIEILGRRAEFSSGAGSAERRQLLFSTVERSVAESTGVTSSILSHALTQQASTVPTTSTGREEADVIAPLTRVRDIIGSQNAAGNTHDGRLRPQSQVKRSIRRGAQAPYSLDGSE